MTSAIDSTHLHAEPAVALPWPAPDASIERRVELVERLAKALRLKRDTWAAYDKAEQETGYMGPRTNEALYNAFARARAACVEARGQLEDALLEAAS